MAGIYVTSPQRGDGKTSVAAALLSLLGGRGLTRYARIGRPRPHPDAAFVKSAIGTVATPEEMTLLPADVGDIAALSRGEPIVVEGDVSSAGELAPVIVTAFRAEQTVRDIITFVETLGARPIGIAINAVPASQVRFVEREIRPSLDAAGIPVLGILTEERILRAATVADLVDFLEGEVLTAHHALDNVVESYMVGAMSHAGGRPYFQRMQHKAVITGGDRIDVHLTALGTPCQCLILTGGFDPDPVAVERAEAEDCPIVMVQDETLPVVDNIGTFLRTVRFRHEFKIQPMADLVRRSLNLGPIEAALGLRVAV